MGLCVERRTARDRGVASTIGFILGFVVLVASMSTVLFFVASSVDPGEEEGARVLTGSAVRAAEVFATTAGEPPNWDTLLPLAPSRIGLLSDETAGLADYDKVGAIRQGTLDALAITKALDLQGAGYTARVEGRVVPVPLLTPPPSRTVAIAHFTQVEPLLANVIDPLSLLHAELLTPVNPDYSATPHDWQFGWTLDPSTGLGDTHPDHAWYVEHDVLMQMAGFAATYVNVNNLNVTPNVAAEDAAFDLYNAGDTAFNRWRVIEDGNPHDTPGTPPSGAHVLGVGFHKTQANDNDNGQGVGLWRAKEGHRAWSVLGPYGIAGANSASLQFSYLVKLLGNGDENRAEILFWNTTGATDTWTRMRSNPLCDVDGIGWDDDGVTQPSTYAAATVNLCEAVENGGGELWLAFYWNTWCELGNGLEKVCTGNDEKHAGWFMDDVQITKTTGTDTKLLFETDFEVPFDTDGDTLFISSGVDFDRADNGPTPTGTCTPSPCRKAVIEYFTDYVDNGGNVLAFAPTDGPTPSTWLGAIGLQPISTGGATAVTTLETNIGIMQMPNLLSPTNASYAPAAYAWSQTATGAYENPVEPLTVVQEITGSSTVATLLTGKPRGPTGGTVTAIGYILTPTADEEARDALVENAFATMVFRDPTFSSQGIPLPDLATVQVASARRVILVPITDDNVYSVPVEVTVYVWLMAT